MQVITGGARTFSALAYQQSHPDNQNYFARKLDQLTTNLTDVGMGFFADAKDLYEKFNGSEAMRLAKAAVRKVQSIWDRDDIRELFGIGEIQHAKPIMQRWIMANPTYRQMYQEQRADGYSDSYVDMHPGTIGETHYDYRRVIDGMLVEDEDEGWKITHCIDDLVEGDVDLELEDKLTIFSVWDFVEHYAAQGEGDPGSAFGDKL